jgi:hypothetical protein
LHFTAPPYPSRDKAFPARTPPSKLPL